MILTKLPAQYKPAEIETLGRYKKRAWRHFADEIDIDPMEVDTADKLVLAALDDGSVRGIHLGTKKEVRYAAHLQWDLSLISFCIDFCHTH